MHIENWDNHIDDQKKDYPYLERGKKKELIYASIYVFILSLIMFILGLINCLTSVLTYHFNTSGN